MTAANMLQYCWQSLQPQCWTTCCPPRK